MNSIEHLQHILQTIETLPKGFVDAFQDEMEEKVEQLLNSIQDFIKSSLYTYSDKTLRVDVEDFSQTQFQDLLKCMFLFNDESGNGNEEEFSDQYHDSIRNCLTEEEEDGCNVLENLCCGHDVDGMYEDFDNEHIYISDDERLRLGTLKYLRQLNLLRKEDITGMELLQISYERSPSIFHYLAKWDPSALKIQDTTDESTLLQESIMFYFPPGLIKVLLKAGLKYLPNELGLLFLTTEDNESPCALLMDKERDTHCEKGMWTIIEECLEEVKELKLYYEPDPDTYLYPFMVAANDQSCPCVDLVYYLLRKDPSVLLQFNPFCNDERRLEEGIS